MSKLCVDCKWHEPFVMSSCRIENLDRCLRPQSGLVSAVSGQQEERFCSVERLYAHSKMCGPQGRFWEPGQ
jgi:hypothetical protein